MLSKLHADETERKMNHVKRVQDLGTLTLGATSILDSAYCQEVAEHIAGKHRFERGTPVRLRLFATGLRQLADAVDEQAVLVAEALAEIECAEPTPEEVLNRGRALLRGDGEDIEGI